MADLSITVFRELLKPAFDWSKFTKQQLLDLAAEAVFIRDIPQRVLGKIVNALGTETAGAIDAISKEIGVSRNTLRIYAYVERKLEGIEVPEDINWWTLRAISTTEDPAAWAKRVIDEGLSAAEVKRLIKIDRGDEPKPVKHRLVVCPSCNFEQEKHMRCENCEKEIE
jgi:hypothetical protein